MNERQAWMDAAVIEDRSFRLADLLDRGENVVVGKTLIRCTLHGPAVIVPLGETRLIRPTWQAASQGELLWEIAPSRKNIIGAIGLSDCRLEDCHLIQIGFASSPEGLANFRANTGWTGGPGGGFKSV